MVGDLLTTGSMRLDVGAGAHVEKAIQVRDVQNLVLPGVEAHAVERILRSLSRDRLAVGETAIPTDFDDLFDLVERPDGVQASVLRGETFRVEMPTRREGEPDIVATLDKALIHSGGGLILESRGGLGYAHEAARIAELWAKNGFRICVARAEGDVRMGAPRTFPSRLKDARALFVVSDLHLRAPDDAPGRPYLARLLECADYFSRRMGPGRSYWLATVTVELANDAAHLYSEVRKRFATYTLPEFESSDLVSVLREMAAQQGVEIHEEQIKWMIDHSDRTFTTFWGNVERARVNNRKLGRAEWAESRGDSWARWFEIASSGAEPLPVADVYRALRLLRKAGLPGREELVTRVAERVAKRDVRPATARLLSLGLLTRRDGILRAFARGQLSRSLKQAGEKVPKVDEHWDDIRVSLLTAAEQQRVPLSDLQTFVHALLVNERFDDAEQVAQRAVELGLSGPGIFLLRGGAAESQERFADSVQHLTKAIELGANDPAILAIRGWALVKSDRYEEAELDFDAAILANHPAHFGRGLARLGMNRGSDAIADFDVAIGQADDADAGPWYFRGKAKFILDDLVGAESDLSQALKLRYEPQALFLRGRVWAKRDEYAKAEQDYSEAVKAGAEGNEIFIQRAFARSCLDQWDGVLEDAERVLASGEYSANAFMCRGMARFAKGDIAAAESDFSSAADFEETAPVAVRSRGLARMKRGAHEAAAEDFRRCIELGGGDPDVWHLLGQALLEADRPEDAVAALTSAIEAGVEDDEVYWHRGRARYELDDDEGAIGDIDRAIERGAGGAFAYFTRGMARVLTCPRDAIDDLSVAIEMEPGVPNFRVGRAMALLASDDNVAAERDVNHALDHGADSEALYWRGRIRHNLERYVEARTDFESALAAGNSSPELHQRLGRTLVQLDEFVAADRELTLAIDGGIDDQENFALRAQVRTVLNEMEGAASDASEAIRRGAANPNLFFARGLNFVKLERNAEAEQDFDYALRANQENPVFWLWRGLARQALDRYAEAASDIGQAIARGTESQDAWPWRAICRIYLDDIDGARVDCDRALELAPESSTTAHATGLLYLCERKYPEAIEQHRFMLDREPSSNSQGILALTLLWAGEIDEAKELFRRALETESHLERAAVRFNLTFFTERQGDRVSDARSQELIGWVRARADDGASRRASN